MTTDLVERFFSSKKRKKLAKKGSAMGDGSFPIENEKDLRNAERLRGHAKNKAAATAHIRRRAEALGLKTHMDEGINMFSLSFKEAIKNSLNLYEVDDTLPEPITASSDDATKKELSKKDLVGTRYDELTKRNPIAGTVSALRDKIHSYVGHLISQEDVHTMLSSPEHMSKFIDHIRAGIGSKNPQLAAEAVQREGEHPAETLERMFAGNRGKFLAGAINPHGIRAIIEAGRQSKATAQEKPVLKSKIAGPTWDDGTPMLDDPWYNGAEKKPKFEEPPTPRPNAAPASPTERPKGRTAGTFSTVTDALPPEKLSTSGLTTPIPSVVAPSIAPTMPSAKPAPKTIAATPTPSKEEALRATVDNNIGRTRSIQGVIRNLKPSKAEPPESNVQQGARPIGGHKTRVTTYEAPIPKPSGPSYEDLTKRQADLAAESQKRKEQKASELESRKQDFEAKQAAAIPVRKRMADLLAAKAELAAKSGQPAPKIPGLHASALSPNATKFIADFGGATAEDKPAFDSSFTVAGKDDERRVDTSPPAPGVVRTVQNEPNTNIRLARPTPGSSAPDSIRRILLGADLSRKAGEAPSHEQAKPVVGPTSAKPEKESPKLSRSGASQLASFALATAGKPKKK